MGPASRLSDGRAELRCGAFAARQENGAWTATPAPEIAGRPAGAASGGGGQRFACVGANALDHGAQAIGTLRRQMIAESKFVEYREGIGGKNLLRRMA